MPMRYALNVTPINGWETHLGEGQADAVLSASGSAYNAFFAEGQAAAMALSADGAGYMVISGLPDVVELALAASGVGLKALTGAGTADQELSAVGVPVVLMLPSGEAGMALAVSGAAVKALVGAGVAEQVMAASGSGYAVITGQAQQADIAIAATGNGYCALFAVADPAVLDLAADGAGYRKLFFVGVDAYWAMGAEGLGYLMLKPVGEAVLAVVSNGNGISAQTGAGQFDMLMTGMAGIPRPIIIPGDYVQTHQSRFVLVENFHDRIDVEPAEPVMVPTERRTFTVPQERSVV